MKLNKHEALERRHLRVRQKISGTPQRPRLCIHKSLKHLYAQIVDDTSGRSLLLVTTNTKDNKSQKKGFRNRTTAKDLGTQVARKAKDAGITKVVFDRGGYKFHGCVKSFAEGAREGGLIF
ncbi:MAG: 50S ribosomal protein L18 [bacterium]